MLPPGFENAPGWAVNLFYVVMALGSGFIALRRIMAGAKDETLIVKQSGRTSTVSEVIDAPASPVPAIPVGLSSIGQGLIDRQIAEDRLVQGKALIQAIQAVGHALEGIEDTLKNGAALSTSVERLAEVYERRVELDEEDDKRRAIQDEAQRMFRELIRDRGLSLDDAGKPAPAPRGNPRRPQQG